MRFILIPVVAGIVLSILAPFHTDSFPMAKRFAYWIGLCVAGGFGAALFEFIAQKLKLRPKMWQIVLAQSVGATIFVAAFLFAMQMPPNLISFAINIFYIWVIAIVISGVGGILRSRNDLSETALNMPAQNAANTRPALYERLAPKLRQAEIYAIVSEDHYVRIYTSSGEEMILMRLSDAVKETKPLPGLTPHRSWWVAEAGVERVNRKDGKTSLTLRNGITAPVSRNGSKAVKEAGWA
ncbi:MAG: LytTR family DNA-binding domain-containing protein [Hellea sp.]